ncbi:SIMPL domain-containing protein [Cytobacillus suaedae]|nr:SIMPL domain-containing protein [Cytobacillus suaedae]
MYPNYYVPYQNGMSQQRPTNQNKSPIIEVEGVGLLKVRPDIVSVRFGVLTEGMDVQNIQDENAKKINDIIEAIVNAGVQKDQIETVSYSVSPQYQYTNNEKILQGYEVRHLLSVRLHDVQSTGVIYDIAFNEGANIAENPIFMVENELAYQMEALQKALQNAVSKAKTIANTLGVILSQQPIRVEEISTNFTPREYGVQEVAASMGTATPIQVREIEFQARVEVQFTFQ